MDSRDFYMLLEDLKKYGVTYEHHTERLRDDQGKFEVKGLLISYQGKQKFFPTPISLPPWMQDRYVDDLTELLGEGFSHLALVEMQIDRNARLIEEKNLELETLREKQMDLLLKRDALREERA